MSKEKINILQYPHPILSQKAKEVTEPLDKVSSIVDEMIELMRKFHGIGLAAPQVGIPWRLFVAQGTNSNSVDVFINPSFIYMSEDTEVGFEFCLSLPGIPVEVARSSTVTIAATDLSGKSFTRTESGLMACCWQHEMDHLDGILIIDKMTQASRMKVQSKIDSLLKQNV